MRKIPIAPVGAGRPPATAVPLADLGPGAAVHDLPIPEPTPNRAAFDRERWACLARSPRKLWNYWRYLRADRRQARVPYLPIRMDFESVSRCNFRCTMCQVSEWPKGKRADDMSFETFKRIIDEQYGLVEIKIQGFGEPLMQGEDYFRMIRYARARRIWTRTTTNASLLHLKDNYRKLIDSGVNEIQISIDGADKETFEKIRVGSVFEMVVENCKLINGYAREKGLVRTKMWAVVQKDNVHQLRDLVFLAHEMGFPTMAFSFDLVDFGNAEWRARNQRVSVKERVSYAAAKELVDLGAERGIRVGIWNVTSKYSSKPASRLCPWPFERSYISSDSRIVPCCIIGNPEAMDLGDARELHKVWNGEEMAAFRQAQIDGRIPEVCKTCYMESD